MQKPRDFREHKPFSWQEKNVLRFLRNKYKGKKLTTSIAIYTVLTEIDSDSGKNDGFLAYYSQIAQKCGKSPSTAKRYCNEFISFYILHKKNIKKGNQNLANKWALLQFSQMKSLSGYDNNHTTDERCS